MSTLLDQVEARIAALQAEVVPMGGAEALLHEAHLAGMREVRDIIATEEERASSKSRLMSFSPCQTGKRGLSRTCVRIPPSQTCSPPAPTVVCPS